MFTVVFRTDASQQIGIGHVMRCLTLADALRQAGASCHFICREHPGNLIDLIRQRGHAVNSLSAPGTTAPPDGSSSAYAEWLGTSWQQDAADCLAVLGSERPGCLVVGSLRA